MNSPTDTLASDALTIGDMVLNSRVLLGTSRYPSLQSMLDAIDAAEAECVTVSIRRVNVYDKADESLLGGYFVVVMAK